MHIEWLGDEAVVLDPKRNQLHYLNPPAALVYALILEHGYRSGLEHLLRSRPDGSQLQEELPDLLEKMLEQGLLVDE
jgi:hypothetical protein